jgi:ABC-type lipoprotein release transport system permease subunit
MVHCRCSQTCILYTNREGLFAPAPPKRPRCDSPSAVRATVRRLEPQALLRETDTLSHIAEESAATTRLATRLRAGFGAIALVLAATGVYGMMAYTVRRRARELGTRLALGASPRAIAWLVLRQAVAIASVGLGDGLAAAVAFARTLSSLLVDVPPWDPATVAAAAGLLVLSTLAASYLPAVAPLASIPSRCLPWNSGAGARVPFSVIMRLRQ